MSKLGLVVVIMLLAGRTNAQDYPAPNNQPPTYFVLMQADDGQAFYVRLDSQVFNSSSGGHLILAHLKDSVYTLTVGFPGNLFPEERFLLNMHQKDWSLHLSRQDNGWGLLDDDGKAVPALADPAAAQMPSGTKKADAFSQLMAAIVQDTSVMYNTYAASPPDSTPNAAAVAPIVRSKTETDTVSSEFTPPAVPAGASMSDPVSSAPSSPTGVVQLSERKSTTSLSLVFTDHGVDKKTDTIDVVIPVDSPANGSLRNGTPAPVSSTPRKSILPFINSDCHDFATDYDLDKLRVRMLNATRDDERIQIAYKTFKTKCFSTRQVSALSEIFTSDAAKFKFLGTAYPFVSDDRFSELISLFSDPVYAAKFRTMTGRH